MEVNYEYREYNTVENTTYSDEYTLILFFTAECRCYAQ